MEQRGFDEASDDHTDFLKLDVEKILFGKRKAQASPQPYKIQICSDPYTDAPHEQPSSLESHEPNKDRIGILSTSFPFLTVEQQCKFSCDLFVKLVVLKQVDKKFICCLAEEDGNQFLILIDQHAAHERVLLEKLIDIHSNRDSDDQLRIRSSAIHPHFNLSLASDEIETLQTAIEHLHRIGLNLTITNNVDVIVTSVPTCFLERESNEVKRGRSSVYQLLAETLTFECIQEIKEKGRLNLRFLPLSVRNVLNSLACHGAVKFGDDLSMNQCIQLMRALGQCQTPFQCAHGRPVMTPLLRLADLEKLHEPKVKSRPHYERLRESGSCTP